ncbi:hypothetical protein HID58_067069 [Brassica napus]|uniref:Uncharacterized protein n=1 Tax=Brassica napus TaxID=3708 RepID=A0ABQ7ZHG0_BRANA|nr:hypothetical protein HID58_067069 [Brassica napus]
MALRHSGTRYQSSRRDNRFQPYADANRSSNRSRGTEFHQRLDRHDRPFGERVSLSQDQVRPLRNKITPGSTEPTWRAMNTNHLPQLAGNATLNMEGKKNVRTLAISFSQNLQHDLIWYGERRETPRYHHKEGLPQRLFTH